MDCAESFKQSKVQLEMIHKQTDGVIPELSNSNSSRTSDLSQDSAVSSIFQSDPPLQPKLEVAESLGSVHTVENSSLSRTPSSSGGSTQIRLSGVLGNHDPNRIPASIFSGRPSNPMEWSTASNESLFSIHVGNNSFSREQFNIFTKSGELMMNPNSSQNLPASPPFVEPARVESETEITVNVFPELATSTGPQIPAISTQSITNHRKEVITPMDELRGRQSESNDSMNSSRSFQFPLLGDDATPKTNRSVSTDSGTTQQQPRKLQSAKQQLSEHQSSSNETTSSSRPAKLGSGWFSCLSWCRCR